MSFTEVRSVTSKSQDTDLK